MEMLADGYIPLECPLCPAVSHFLGKLSIVLFKEFQQSFLFDTDTEIGILEFGNGNITVRLHQFLIVTVYLHTDFIHCVVDSLFTSHSRNGTSILQLNCLISPSTVRWHINGRLPLGFSLPFFT